MASRKAIEAGRQRRRAILLDLQTVILREGYAPTYRELAEAQGLSVNGVREHLKRLAEEGYVDIVPGIARGITLTPKGRRVT